MPNQRNVFETLTARAPGKLIISGEHAVVYGQPALAMAVDRYTSSTINWHVDSEIKFKFLNLFYATSLTLKALQQLKQKLTQDYNHFLHGQCQIRAVLKRPYELLQYAAANVLDKLNVVLTSGVEITVHSNIPIGCGMGSSAAAVLSTVYAMTNFLETTWPAHEYATLSTQIENLQHGKSSGLDVHLATYGGCVRYAGGVAEARPVPQFPLYIVNTGAPESSTGECVSAVAAKLQDPALANEFAAVTNLIDQAMLNHNLLDFKSGIRSNHALLQEIGVVPTKVAEFIHALETYGGAAKICGAGAISGTNAGVVLICADADVATIAQQHGYTLQAIQVDTHGTRII